MKTVHAHSEADVSSVNGRVRSEPLPCAFVIFGVTGDLAARKLLPALWALQRAGHLAPDTKIVGFARSDGDDATLAREALAALRRHVGPVEPSAWQSFERRLRYVQGRYDDPASYDRLGATLTDLGLERRIFYTSTPPATYESIASGLAASGLATASGDGYARLVIEKPFGHDLDSALALNAHLRTAFAEHQIYRIDHYLAKETAQNLAVLRFANALFEPIWSNKYVDHVQITMTEPMGVEGRGGFYESAGVVRDVFQNHLLQLLSLVAMEPPATWTADAVRDEKVKVLRATTCAGVEEMVFGQYAAAGESVGYRDEPGVDPRSTQATYAAVAFSVATWRWSGVPFYVRSGKRLETKASEIVLHFKTPPHVPFALDGNVRADRLVLRITPDEGIRLVFNAKRPGQGMRMGRVSLDFTYEGRFDAPPPDAYETLLLDVMHGDATLFMREDEVAAQWRIVAPLLAAAESGVHPHAYDAGGRGPDAAYALLERSGRYWHAPEGTR